MAGTFSGAIWAEIGANTKDYEKAMDRIASVTQSAFRKAQDSAVNSSSRMIQRIGQIMAQLANNGDSLGKRLGTSFSTGLNLSIGEIQRVAARIGEKIPEPIKAGFQKALAPVQSTLTTLSNKVSATFSSIGSKTSVALEPVKSAFTSLVSRASAAATKINESFAGRVLSSVTKLSSKITGTLASGFTTLSSKATSALNGISQKFASASSAGQKLHSTIAQIAAGFSLVAIAQKGLQVLTGALDGAISRLDTMNRFPKTMALLGYSAEQSKSSVDKLSKGIEGLPTTLDSVVSAAQQLTITTGSLDRGTDLALAFNNAMVGYGATTENAELALRQFNQALGAGRFQAEEFNSVAEAAPGLMNRMAESFGKNNVPELKKALSDGKISMDQFADKMIELNGVQGGFAEMALTSAGGIRTAMGNVKNAVVRGVADMISKFDEAAKANGLNTITENLLALKSNILSAFDTVNSIIPNLVAAFARLKSMVNIDTSGFGSIIN